MKLEIGDKVIKNPEKWIITDFDSWGRGIGVGTIVEPPFVCDENEFDVKWQSGRCFETGDQLIKI